MKSHVISLINISSQPNKLWAEIFKSLPLSDIVFRNPQRHINFEKVSFKGN